MKIRNGFVSNSSSSSFVIIGKKIEGSSLKEEMLKRNSQAVAKWLSEQTPNKYYDYKELNDGNVQECYWDIGDKIPLGIVDDGYTSIMVEGIKIRFDDDTGLEEHEYDFADFPKGSKIYVGREAT